MLVNKKKESVNKKSRRFQVAVITAAVAAGIAMTGFISASAQAETQKASVKLLSANFEARQVVQVEVGDFHFKPGQVAPIHTHMAPAVGYVAKGEIIYQVEGERQQILHEGDVFYEPAGPRILRFDNASATEEAIFLDFNLERLNEPFIVFEKPPSEAIDRRTMPTVDLGKTQVEQVDIYTSEIQAGGSRVINNPEPTLVLVAEGVIELKTQGQRTQRIIAGGSFAIPEGGSQTNVLNASDEVIAKLITFRLR